MNQKSQALILGLITIFCWGSLATFSNLVIHLPPFYVLGVTFLFGALPAFFKPKQMFPNLKTTAVGVFGLFGYHFFLFYSFRYAPAVEANLINYMWPVLMVIISPVFFKNEKLFWYHIAGAVLAVIGCVVLVFGKGGELKSEYVQGYLLAAGAAITWPLYSMTKKKLPPVSVWAVGGFCLGASILSFLTHALIEPAVSLVAHDAWILLVMGLGPFGLAFYCWDLALSKGDTRLLGALAYLTPVLSTLGLVLFVGQTLAQTTVIAMVLIIGGASSGLLDFLPRKKVK